MDGDKKGRNLPPTFVGAVEGDLTLHFSHLKLHHGMVLVAFAVVFCQDGAGFVGAVLTYEPARGFGEEEYEAGDGDGGAELTPDGDAECVGAADEGTSVAWEVLGVGLAWRVWR